ncbi:MAG: hypothetical protein P4M01_09130 [Acidobacteriota bacterium]|nr:hypothetical protein [Acidobacteriota bacterium]
MNQSSKPESDATGIEITEAIPFDCNYLLSCAAGDAGQLARLCTVFLTEIPLHMDQLREALKLPHSYPAEKAVHGLRECLLLFGSSSFTFRLELLSTALRAGRMTRVRREYQFLSSQLRVLQPQVQRLLLETAAPVGSVQ